MYESFFLSQNARVLFGIFQRTLIMVGLGGKEKVADPFNLKAAYHNETPNNETFPLYPYDK